jgi:AraC-like DNA-binding protein
MSMGGQLSVREQSLQAWLVRAYTGQTRFRTTGWKQFRWKFWALDCINHGQQPQRVTSRQTFTRRSNVSALYRPGKRYQEWQEAGGSLNESYILFQLTGEMEKAFNGLVGRKGYCHFHDPDELLSDGLRRIGELLFHRRPGFRWLTQGAFFQLLGLLATTQPEPSGLRVVKRASSGQGSNDMPARVERYVREHIAGPVRVTDMARHVNLSVSSFAHAYSELTDESPYQTVVRLKIETAKRMMMQDGLNVKETAFRLGYSSEFQFSRAFKRLEGVSPMRHIRALTEKTRG